MMDFVIDKDELIKLLDKVVEYQGSPKQLQDVYVHEFNNRLIFLD
jgi:hypothetical protein